MKKAFLTSLSVVCSLLVPQIAGQERKGDDPYDFFPPELVLVHQEGISLSDGQREEIMDAIHETQEASPGLQREVQEAARDLSKLLKAVQPDVEAALAQFDELQAAEAKVKRQQFELMLRIKTVLNAEQQKELNVLKQRGPAQFPPESVQKKLDEIQSEVQKWVNDERDPAAIAEMMQEFSPLIQEGKLKEAHALLDRVLKKVHEKK